MTTQNTQMIDLTLFLEEVNLILSALGELPAKHSNGLINKLQAIANEQLTEAAAAAASSSTSAANDSDEDLTVADEKPRNGFRTPKKSK